MKEKNMLLQRPTHGRTRCRHHLWILWTMASKGM